ncbi:hypothetical protein [Fulvivirga sp.]|uniref:hypothetical protein n=1 Tax=Fulvivirga sp. TaxID=1931237 RepID=UPI0032EBCB02
MKKFRIVVYEILLTVVTVIGLIASALTETIPFVKFIVILGLILSIVYSSIRAYTKLEEFDQKEAIRHKIRVKLNKAAESILYYISLILINHENQIVAHGENKNAFQTEEAALRFFQVDFRNPDPHTGTSVGNLADQVSSGLQRLKSEIHTLLSQYFAYIGHSDEVRLIQTIFDNEVFHSLLHIDLTFEQLSKIYSEVNNPTFPKDGLPITITLDPIEYRKDYNELIDQLFELKKLCPT